MKVFRIFSAALLLSLLLLGAAGCEYDGATAVYYQEHAATPAPEISAMDPARSVTGGVNYITITGTDFSDNPANNGVYFSGYAAEIVESSSTSIQVRRPNVTGDTITVKVVCREALTIAEFGPYEISPVYVPYGGFITGEALSGIAFTPDGTAYVTQRSPRKVFRITSDGTRTEIGETQRAATEVRIAPDGNLAIFRTNKTITRVDVNTGEETDWVTLPKSVTHGDFDGNGVLYAGGNKSDLEVMQPDETVTSIGVYAKDKILHIQVHGGYVYLLADLASPDETNPDIAIWRHQILDAAGLLGDRELVLDWSTTGEFAGSTPACFNLDDEGTLYVGTDYEQAILMLTPDGKMDILYKDILPTSADKLVWGPDGYLYMVLGGDTGDILQIDLGQ